MRHSKSVRLGMQIAFGVFAWGICLGISADFFKYAAKTAPTGGESVYLFLEFTIVETDCPNALALFFPTALEVYLWVQLPRYLVCW